MPARRRGRRRTFLSDVDHLGPEAVAAFVDGELTPQAEQRASTHLEHCPECREEIERQRAAAEAIHAASDLRELKASAGLLAKLASIERECSPDGPNADSVTACRPAGLVDRMEVFLRTVRRAGHEPDSHR